MARRKPPQPSKDWLFPRLSTTPYVEEQSSLLDIVDNVLNRGVVLNGDLTLGVANVDLIYAKLSVLLAAIDRIMEPTPTRRRKHEGPRRARRSTKIHEDPRRTRRSMKVHGTKVHGRKRRPREKR